ncbi:AGAP000385-PC-like protein [Anopheles sinensis]|uniref:AGAP000385-PC-like protein n=1 Tax=Anopheles sinensis TaxID=74873 RepID=A0A084VVJ1_ANOSI|nr:AGAP000385-PC-like protein [Anopheles sinensis]
MCARAVANRAPAGRLPAALLLLLLGFAPLATVRPGAAASAIGLLTEMTIKILPRIIANMEDANNVSLPFVMNENKLILKRLNDLSLQLMDGQASMVANIQHYTAEVVHMSSVQNRFIERIESLYALIGIIARRERTMNALLQSTDPHEPLTLTQFALATVDMSNRDSVIELMHRIETLVLGDHLISLPVDKQNIFVQLGETASSAICGFGLSPQQMIYSLYESVALTELKGYIMMQFSYMLLKTQGKGNFTVESEERKLEMQTRLNRTQDLLHRVMQQTRSDYWRCDPEQGKHRENVTYVQFTRLLQGYIENEVDMNADNTCRETCAHYQYGHEQHQCYKELYCAKQPKCAGRIYECEYIDSDMTICPAAPGSQRRYEYIEYENGELRGRKLSHCPYGTSQVESWWRWLFWHCSYCFCLCDDVGRHSDRYVSLRQSVSDIENNKVVTGLRFVKVKQVVHLIVQQGKLLPGGEIQNDTIEWVTPARFSPLDRGIRSEKDYHTLTYEKRAIDLDDIRVSAGYVLTGVRFRLLGSHLNLEIRMTEMNFTSGTLVDLDKSIWIGNDDTERTEIAMKYKDIPTRATGKSVPVSHNGQFLRFGPTGGRLDAQQTTIPFMDAQPVYTIRPGPLSGAGLLYKSLPNFGGYIAPKLFSYDYGPHIQTPADDWFAAEQLKRSELEERSTFG